MKKIAAWAFLLIYLNAAAQSLLPWVSDCMAHAFFWQEHLEHVHNGHVHSHHVSLEVAANAGDNHDHLPVGHTAAQKDALSAHVVPIFFSAALPTPELRVPLNIRWSFVHRPVYSDIFLPPPDRFFRLV